MTSWRPGSGRPRRNCSTCGSRWRPGNWTTTGDCAPFGTTSRGSTRSCESGSSARRWHQAKRRSRHERASQRAPASEERSDAGDERAREEQRNIGMSESEGMSENVRTSHRKTREGRVVSDKMDKTVVVAVEDRGKDALYGKVIRRTNKLKAHDEQNECGVGDRVLLAET